MRSSELLPLLDHLAATNPDEEDWCGWRIQRVGGGANNLIHRATCASHDLAIKWTIRDERDRAGREHAALSALREAGLDIAPAPLLLDRERYAQPVVVQTWLSGEVTPEPPRNDDEWQHFLEHHAAIHSIAPGAVAAPIRPAVLNMASAADGRALIARQLEPLPASERPPELRALLRQLERAWLPEWPAPAPRLCRVDPNPVNFVRRLGVWASVDWENSGWGDAAFEIADAIAHPSYASVPKERWQWVVAEHCALTGDPHAARRIDVYRYLMLFWWVARFARALYEVPRGGDRRLADRPVGWAEDMQAKYRRYLALAVQMDMPEV
jgi:hypothetical protein